MEGLLSFGGVNHEVWLPLGMCCLIATTIYYLFTYVSIDLSLQVFVGTFSYHTGETSAQWSQQLLHYTAEINQATDAKPNQAVDSHEDQHNTPQKEAYPAWH